MKLSLRKILILFLISLMSLPTLSLNLTKWTNIIEQTQNPKQKSIVDQKFKNEVVLLLVYSSTCGYCIKFAPNFKKFVTDTGIAYKALTADGGVLPAFADAAYLPETLDRLKINIYPTVFAFNKINNKTLIFSQGYLTLDDLYKNYAAVSKYMYEDQS